MLGILKHECKMNIKNLLLWSLVVGGMGFACILLFTSMEDSMGEMAESFSNMGAFSDAFGMSTLSIGTLSGYFATEIGVIHGLGGAMFAASLATILFSKEEDGHTAEFLYSLPLSRGKVVAMKLSALVLCLVMFQVICASFYGVAFGIIGKGIEAKLFFLFLIAEFILSMEVAAICLVISAFNKTNKLGVGLGVTLMFYAYDLIARVIPDLEDYIVFGPFSYANGSEIFLNEELKQAACMIGMLVIILCTILACVEYTRRDLSC